MVIPENIILKYAGTLWVGLNLALLKETWNRDPSFLFFFHEIKINFEDFQHQIF